MSIKSKSNAVRGTKGSPLFQSATVETVSGHITSQEQRIEQMYQLAHIFASIFEALPDEHEHHFVDSIRRRLAPGDALLLGTDLVKPTAQLLDAYDDPTGVTAAFNLNLLGRINRELARLG